MYDKLGELLSERLDKGKIESKCDKGEEKKEDKAEKKDNIKEKKKGGQNK